MNLKIDSRTKSLKEPVTENMLQYFVTKRSGSDKTEGSPTCKRSALVKETRNKKYFKTKIM